MNCKYKNGFSQIQNLKSQLQIQPNPFSKKTHCHIDYKPLYAAHAMTQDSAPFPTGMTECASQVVPRANRKSWAVESQDMYVNQGRD